MPRPDRGPCIGDGFGFCTDGDVVIFFVFVFAACHTWCKRMHDHYWVTIGPCKNGAVGPQVGRRLQTLSFLFLR